MSATQIRDLFLRLPHPQQFSLLRELKEEISRDPLPADHIALFREIRETRFSDGPVCPRCQSRNVIKNGRYKQRQRYLCGDCERTFNDLTNTPLSGTRYFERMLEYFKLMVENKGHLPLTAYLMFISMAKEVTWLL
jgi:transposase-like protein